jgi:multidrug efflux pump
MQIQEHNPSSEQRNSNWVVRWTALALPVVLVLGALAGVGFLGLRFLRERQLQDELAPVPPIEIAVIYPGASAEIVESTITDALEQQLAGTSGIRRIESHSMPGVSKIIVHLDPGVDRQFLMELVRNRAALAQPILPAGAGQPAFSSR